jgi:hypothetical protein
MNSHRTKKEFLAGVILSFWMLTSLSFRSIDLEIENVAFTDVIVDYKFDQSLVIEGKINRPSTLQDIKDVYIVLQPESSPSITEKLSLVQPDRISFEHDLYQNPWYPFERIEFNFHVLFQDGSEENSENFWFVYEDNRFTWQNDLSDQDFRISWNSGEQEIGYSILEIARAGLHSVQSYLPIKPSRPIQIIAYQNTGDLQDALRLDQQYWVAGHTIPEMSTIYISIPVGPSQQFELERMIPHEISHVLEYSFTGGNLEQLPPWLVEGIASISETYPNPDYLRILDSAINNKQLIPIQDLCISFPTDASTVYLAYAQSASFTRFLYKKFGSSGLQNVMLQYADGLDCQEGIKAVFGMSLSQLEYRWQQEVLGVNTTSLVFQNISPYLLLLLIVGIIPITPYLFRHRHRQDDDRKKE